jgi:thiamine-phosphate pyrophosphorylase
MKGADDELLARTAHIVGGMCREYGATFIIDDNVELVRAVGADGVHLGKSDMPIAEARKILGHDYIIGATVNSFEDIINTLSQATPDYFGCGPYRYTTTKQNLAPILHLEGYREIVGKMRESNISIPIVAIGGICKEDVSLLMDTGIDGIALSGSVLRADDPIRQMRLIKDIINGKH